MAQSEEVAEWITEHLDFDHHNGWVNSPNYETLRHIGELLAPRIIQRETTTFNKGVEVGRERIWLEANKLPVHECRADLISLNDLQQVLTPLPDKDSV